MKFNLASNWPYNFSWPLLSNISKILWLFACHPSTLSRSEVLVLNHPADHQQMIQFLASEILWAKNNMEAVMQHQPLAHFTAVFEMRAIDPGASCMEQPQVFFYSPWKHFMDEATSTSLILDIGSWWIWMLIARKSWRKHSEILFNLNSCCTNCDYISSLLHLVPTVIACRVSEPKSSTLRQKVEFYFRPSWTMTIEIIEIIETNKKSQDGHSSVFRQQKWPYGYHLSQVQGTQRSRCPRIPVLQPGSCNFISRSSVENW